MNAMAPEMIRLHARALRMPGLARSFEKLCREAQECNWSYEDLLREALATEIHSRTQATLQTRLREARFPEHKTLDSFRPAETEGIEAALIADLAGCRWIEERRNLVIAGPIGTGKTHLAIALGIEATRRRMRVAFFRTADLVRMLVEARDQRQLGLLLRRLQKVRLLILDELGFVPFDRQGGELLFNVIADRYERGSVALTTNLNFSEWPRVFGDDEKLTTALLDRLAHHAVILTTRGESYRLKNRSAADLPLTESAGA
jgi:DNA replication protein DnaC